MIDPQGGRTSYSYDALNRLASLVDFGGRKFGFSYDELSRRTELRRPNGVATYYSYDSLSRLVSIEHQRSSLEGFGVIDGSRYTYDRVGNRTSKTDLRPLIDEPAPPGRGRRKPGPPRFLAHLYSYDNIYQLTQVVQNEVTGPLEAVAVSMETSPSPRGRGEGQGEGFALAVTLSPPRRIEGSAFSPSPSSIRLPPRRITETYTYDGVGNRLSSIGLAPYTYNESNHLLSTPQATYAYDHNGNLTSKTDSTGTTTYTWDVENRLVGVTLPTGSTVNFSYDPFGRRIRKGAISYLYDGANMLAELDGGGNLAASYVMSLEIDEPLLMNRAGILSYYHADGLGSIVSLTDFGGDIATSYTYDSFGNHSSSNDRLGNPFLYTGREFDVEVGLYYYRARYYGPTVGRFFSEDPTGFNEGLNWYTYVRNSPLNLRDPTGRFSQTATCILTWALAGSAGGALIGAAAGATAGCAAGAVAGGGVGCIPVGAAGAAGGAATGALYGGTGGLLVGLITCIDYDIDRCEPRRRSDKWTCLVRCNVQPIGGQAPPTFPSRVEAYGFGPTQAAAFQDGQRKAQAMAPRGTYTRHCHAVRCWKR